MEQLQKFAIFSGGFVLSFARAQLLRQKAKGTFAVPFSFFVFKCLPGGSFAAMGRRNYVNLLAGLASGISMLFLQTQLHCFCQRAAFGCAYAIFLGCAAVVACLFRSSTLPDLAEVVAQQHRSWRTKYFRRGNRYQCK